MDSEDSPRPWFGLGDPKPYGRSDWERWRGGWNEASCGEPSLRFDGEGEGLAFWLVVLIAGGERAGAAYAVRAEILHAMERIRADYALGPHIDGILRNYRPLLQEESLASAPGRVPSARWNPASSPPRWLREAIEMEPLRLHVTPPKAKEGRFIVTMRKIVREGKKTFLAMLSQNPSRAMKWAVENRSQGPLVLLAERVAERRFLALLDEDEDKAVKWARSNWPDGEWKAILKARRKRMNRSDSVINSAP